jgi:ubiquinone/menaquinone biosynthesis C-methylase UbiE
MVAALVSIGRWKRWVFSSLPYIDGPLVLEIGHGPGHLLKAMTEKGLNAYGLDASRWMGKQTKIRLMKTTATPSLLVNGYAQFIPFRSNLFYQVVSTFPSEFILDPITLSEIFRVLVPEGCLIVLPQAWIIGSTLLDKLAAWLFNFTGQSTAWDDSYLEPFQDAGFIAQTKTQQVDGSLVIHILARKPA